MASTGNLRKRGQTWLTYAVLLFLGILVGHAIPSNSATPASVTGMITAVTPGSGTAATTFTLTPAKGKPTRYTLTDYTSWQVSNGRWTVGGTPPCMTPASVRTTSSAGAAKAGPAVKPKAVTIGVISVPSFGSFSGADYVAWVRCPA